MHRGKVAHALLPQIAIEQGADAIVISEQYSKMTTGLWFEDESETAAIWLPCSSRVQVKSSGRGNGFVWIQLPKVTLISCYLTPSDNVNEFEAKMDNIEDIARDIGGNLLVAGDFNSRAIEWGMQTTNSRGRRILDMAARIGLMVANTGNVPTYRRPGCDGTIPDITLISERAANKMEGWKVLEIYTASDHQYISFSLSDTVPERSVQGSTRRWNVNKLNTSALLSEIDRQIEATEIEEDADANITVDRTMAIIKKGCNKAMPKMVTRRNNKTAVHWWNDSINEARRNCIRHRRNYTRAKRRGEAVSEHLEYKEAKKQLKIAINKSKKEKWEELREDINRDPWGLGYKIVMKKLGKRNPMREMDDETMLNVVKTLFPKHDLREDAEETAQIIDTPLFTVEEIKMAANSLQSKKAPGPDGIPAEVMKELATNRPQMLLNMYNKCLKEGTFPTAWKEQRLVLISKGKGDPELPSSYRPLCMLDTAGKLLERLMKPRLEKAITAGGGLSPRQYGFRPRKSTIGAIKDVVDIFTAAQHKNHHSRPLVLLATLDVKNAFNSLRWVDVLHALERNFKIPEYLMRIIRNYLKDRVLIYDTTGGTRRFEVTSGAAQGSILGPDLWNASYDEILKLEMPEDTFLVGYADDIAAVIQARTTEDAQRKLRQVMIRTKTWLDSHGLQLATHKTELLLLTRRQIPIEIDFRIDDVGLRSQKTINYLGVRLDPKLTYWNQIQYSTSKAAKITSQLCRLMANVGGPSPCKRKLLMEACNSILLYGSEIWAQTLNVKHRAKKLLSTQRTAALRVSAAYRTVSAPAVLVIAGMYPLDLQAIEKMRIYNAKQNDPQAASEIAAIKQETLEKWQMRWRNEIHGRWTYKMIPILEKWVNRANGEVNYYLTQLLSGHGYFRKFLHTMGKCSTPFCFYEEEEIVDDAEHTFFGCQRWSEYRSELETAIGPTTATDIVDKMLERPENWTAVARYVEQVLRRKKQDLDSVTPI